MTFAHGNPIAVTCQIQKCLDFIYSKSTSVNMISRPGVPIKTAGGLLKFSVYRGCRSIRLLYNLYPFFPNLLNL
jgi:hypothetical protein